MKRIYIYLILQVMMLISVKLQAQHWEWIKHIGGKGTDEAKGFALDSKDHIYLLFTTTDTLTIDNNTVFNGTYLAKYDSSGTLLWIKLAPVYSSLINIDKTDNILLGGIYNYSSFIISKYDSSFTFNWSIQFNTVANVINKLTSLILDKNNNILISGDFNKWLTINNDTLFAHWEHDEFIIKINPLSNVINYIHIFFLTDGYDDDHFLGNLRVNTDNDNNIFFSGVLRGIIQINTDVLISTSGSPEYCSKTFLCKYDSSFNFKWEKLLNNGCIGGNLAITSNNIFMEGLSKGSILLEDTLIAGNDSNYSAFILKLDTSYHFLNNNWGYFNSNPNYFSSAWFGSMYIDSVSNFIIEGNIVSTPMIIGQDTINNISQGYSSLILKFNQNLDFLSYKQIMFTNSNSRGHLFLSNDKNSVYCWGNFKDTAYFDNYTYISKSDNDFYLAKINSKSLSLEPIDNNYVYYTVYPNPTTGNILINSGIQNQKAVISIYDMYGRSIYSCTTKTFPLQISLIGNKPGLYFVKITTDKNIYTKKIIIE